MRHLSFLLAIILSLTIIGCSTAEDGKLGSEESDSVSESTAENETKKETESEKETEAVTEPANGSSAETRGYKQPQFFISTFMAFPQNRGADLVSFKKTAALCKEAGINLIENAILGKAEGLAAFKACESAGIRFLAQNITAVHGFSGMGKSAPKVTDTTVEATVKEMSKYDYFEGYFIWDEPYLENLDTCGDIKKMFKERDPDTLAYSLMLPSYGDYKWNSKENNYEKYVNEYIEKVDPDVLSFDYYPIHSANTKLTDSELWRDLGLLRKKSIETGKPLWLYFQAYNMDLGFEFTPEMISTQMYCGLAYGVKCLSYYGCVTSLVSGTGKKQPLYDDAKAINQRVQNIGNLLFNAASKELYHFGISNRNRNNFYLDDAESSALISSAPNNTIVGVFEEGDKKYIIVSSKDFKKAINGTLELKYEVNLSSFDPETAETSPIGKVKSTALELPAGGCAVFVVE